jgi:glycosyltransferase involved in cell wall biosynthesis
MNTDESLSICIIAKDDLHNVKRLLENVQGLGAEIVIVDTGSPAEVIAYETQQASTVIRKQWNHDFAYMRNFAIETAQSAWILMLDTDETITEELKRKIPSLLSDSDIEGYNFKRIHFVDEKNPLVDYWFHLRLFRRHAHYFGAIHESIKNVTKTENIDCENCSILHHNPRSYQRIKSLKYVAELRSKIQEARASGDSRMADYYAYKLWIVENIHLLESLPTVDFELLKKRYAEYEKRKKYINARIKKEAWPVETY